MDGCREIAAAYNLLPNALLVLGGDALFPAFLNSGQAVFEGVLIAWRSTPAFDAAFAWNACHSISNRTG
jgi:hypothetical protein